MDSVEYFQEQRKLGNDSKRFRILSSDIYEGLRRAQNTPVQSAAGDLTVFAGWMIKLRMEKAGLDSQIISNVHDSLWVDIPSDDEVIPVAAIMRDVMDNAKDWLPDLLPGYNTDWMVVPIIGENELGINAKDALVVSTEPTALGDKPSSFMEFELGDLGKSEVWKSELGDRIRIKTIEETGAKKYYLPWEGNSASIRKLLTCAESKIELHSIPEPENKNEAQVPGV
jgi:hypothetical protein